MSFRSNLSKLNDNDNNINTASAAALTSHSLRILDPIVSHTTDSLDSVRSILNDGIKLKSHPLNRFGGQAFYVAKGGLSIHEVRGDYTIAFNLSRAAKIYDVRNIGGVHSAGVAKALVQKGFDAVKYESFNGGDRYNLAIIQNPKYLSPMGIYPVLENVNSVISLNTIRGIQLLGIAGTGFAIYHAGERIINSPTPVFETVHQTGIFAATIRGGMLAGARAIIPCSNLGSLFPPAAGYTVPICIAASSLTGAYFASKIMEFAWQSVFNKNNDYPIEQQLESPHVFPAVCPATDMGKFFHPRIETASKSTSKISSRKRQLARKNFRNPQVELKQNSISENNKDHTFGPSDDSSMKQIDPLLQQQNIKLKACLSALVNEVNSSTRTPQFNPVAQAQEFCEGLNAASQGIALVANIAGKNRFAQQVTASSAGISQIVMGVAQIAASGFSAGPVGMVFGGMNVLISCFGSAKKDKSMAAMAEQLAIVSQQIHALHKDMLMHFGAVFASLGVINTNIIEGFRLLHKDQENILENVLKLQKNITSLQDSVNSVGHKVDVLDSNLRGYVLEDDRKQLQLILNTVREKSKRPFNRLKLHPEVIAAFKTFNEELIARKLNAETVSSLDISKYLTINLGSAEANTGLLLNYAKYILKLSVKQPIADPELWRATAGLLIDMVNKTSVEKKDAAIIGEQDFEDFKYLRQIGDNWLDLIKQFKSNPHETSKLSELFQHYRLQIKNLIRVLEKEIAQAELVTKSVIPKYQGEEQFKKQCEFKYEFKRNHWFEKHTKNSRRPAKFRGSYYSGDLDEHIANRKKDITQRLEKYKVELEARNQQYAANYISYFTNINHIVSHSAAQFILPEGEGNTLPMLPLPNSTDQFIGKTFIEAEMLNLGRIKHTYRIENDQFIYKIHFLPTDESAPILVNQHTIAVTYPHYLNPAEAAWLVYMGGEYPESENYSLVFKEHYTPNGDYHEYNYCAMPKMKAFAGLRQELVLPKQVHGNEVIEQKLEQKKIELLRIFNERVRQQLESPDLNNPLAAALIEFDAGAKILIAFLTILFRDKFKYPAAIWTRNQILEFTQAYQNQKTYLHHQLEANLAMLEILEKNLIAEFNLQTESAYTPVKNTLQQLTDFMDQYEQHVLNDKELATKEKMTANKDLVILSTVKTSLALQTELLNSGHVEAALHISQLLARSGLNLPAMMGSETPPTALIALRRNRLFPTNTERNVQEDQPANRINLTG